MVVLALFLLAFLFYTYVAYPVLVAILAHLRPMRIDEDPGYRPKVSAIVPVFNARSYVGPKLDSLLALDYPPERLEIIVCSDASDDGTDDVLLEYAERHQNVVYRRAAQRSGKPAGINRMLEDATGDVLLMTDIRQPLRPSALRALVAPLADPSVAAVSGNLVLAGRAGAGVYWRYENWLRRSEGRFRSMVGVTGPLYAIRRSDMPALPADIILDDMWVPMRLRLQGKKIVFAESAIAEDEAFSDRREFGRKARTLAGNYQLFARLPGLLVPWVNPSFFEVMSHKVFRLLGPWALILLAVVSVLGSAHPLLFLLAVAQAIFYALALAGKAAGPPGAIARTFVVLNAAALYGLYRYIAGSQKVTW